jgi:phage terminase small subunit
LSFLFAKGGGYMLTAKQEQFVKNIIDGMSQTDAYRNSYDTKRMADKTIHEKASRLMADDKVRARLQELRDLLAKPTIMTAQERLELLTRIAKGEEPEKVAQYVNGEMIVQDFPASLRTRKDAIDIMNKMTGEYTQKIDATVSYEDNLRKLVGEDEY